MTETDESVDELLQQLENPTVEVRAFAAQRLGPPTDDERALPALRRSLTDLDAAVRGASAQALAIYGDTGSLAVITELVRTDPGVVVSPMAWSAVRLASIAPANDAHDALSAVAELADRASPDVRRQVAILLGQTDSAIEGTQNKR